MNLKNIKIGDIIPNYKKLCELLEETPRTGGDSKISHLEYIKSFIEFERQGRKFIINKIYKAPQFIVDGRTTGAKSIYSKYVQLLLLQYLVHEKKTEFACITKTDIYKLLGMVNADYNNPFKEKEFLEYHSDISKSQLSMFKARAYLKMNSILDTSLKSLRQRRLISYFPEVTIVPIEGKSYIATEEEIRLIDNIEHQVLKSLGCGSINHVFLKQMQNAYYQRVGSLMSQRGWKSSYRHLKIIYTSENAISAITTLEKDLAKKEINDKFVNFVRNKLSIDKNNYDNRLKLLSGEELPDHSELDKKLFTEDCINNFDIYAAAFMEYVTEM